jgi:hypothetical protein
MVKRGDGYDWLNVDSQSTHCNLAGWRGRSVRNGSSPANLKRRARQCVAMQPNRIRFDDVSPSDVNIPNRNSTFECHKAWH